MFISEPILVCISLYTSFVYAIPFMFFQCFPIVFYEQRRWGPVVATLPFFAILIGSIVGTAINFAAQPWYVKAVKRNSGQAVPEARLPPIVIGAGLLSIGLFWFGWTAAPKISWIAPAFAGGKFSSRAEIESRNTDNSKVLLALGSPLHFSNASTLWLIYMGLTQPVLCLSTQLCVRPLRVALR